MYSSSTVYIFIFIPNLGEDFHPIWRLVHIFPDGAWVAEKPPSHPPAVILGKSVRDLRGGVVTMFKGIPEEQQWAQVKAAVQEHQTIAKHCRRGGLFLKKMRLKKMVPPPQKTKIFKNDVIACSKSTF